MVTRSQVKKKEKAFGIATAADAATDLSISDPAYIGKVLGVGAAHPELEEELRLGRELIEWDGRCVSLYDTCSGAY